MAGWVLTFTAYDLLWRDRFWNTEFVRSKVERQLKEQCFLLSYESMIDWPEQSVCTSESGYTTTEETFGTFTLELRLHPSRQWRLLLGRTLILKEWDKESISLESKNSELYISEYRVAYECTLADVVWGLRGQF